MHTQSTSSTARPRPRRTALLAALALVLGVLTIQGGVAPADATSHAGSGGPVVLMGIDSEDGGPGAHGPLSVYANVVDSILEAATNGGEGILVIGEDGVTGSSNVRNFWNGIATVTGEAVTFVGTAAGVSDADFDGYAVLAVVTSTFNMVQPAGDHGLSNAENEALIGRAADVAEFVNDGGGLFASSQTGLTNAWGFIGQIGAFETLTNLSYDTITPTAAGADIGITTALNVCCWHDVFTQHPAFLEVLAYQSGTTRPAAIGGVAVTIPTGIDLAPESASLEIGQTHTVTATVEDDGAAAAGTEVSFLVTEGPHAGESGTGTTDGDGNATFSYQGTTVGTDSIRASFVDSLDRERTSNTVTATWTDAGTEPDPDDPAFEEETAWADGDRFVARGNWATYLAGEPDLRSTLIAAQHHAVGTVDVRRGAHDGCASDEVAVRYDITTADVFITEVHFVVADELDGIPTTRNGHPQPGQFDREVSGYSASYDLASEVTEVAFCVPDPDGDAASLYAAAHAVVAMVAMVD